MKISVPRQVEPGETRVALSPQVVKKLSAMGLTVAIEAGAGEGSHYSDASYAEAGASIVAADDALRAIWSDADIIVTLGCPDERQIEAIKPQGVLIGMLAPLANLDRIRLLAQGGVTAFSMEFVPRISRAQAMDVLSSQANIGGYKAVLIAAEMCPKLFPMMMTAAGTIPPSKVFVIGAGVAGLQAIATARRLGAMVEAYDVRPAVKEQVQSLGARFVELPMTKQDAETRGGYAKQQSDEERQKQVELMARHVTGADAVITTAAIFGKAPPMLIPASMVEQMQSGSIIVDLAADARAGRGNCELTRPGQRYTTDNGVVIEGATNLPALVSVHSSMMYANNMFNFLREIIAQADGKPQLVIKADDEIQQGAMIAHGGNVTNNMVAEALGVTATG